MKRYVWIILVGTAWASTTQDGSIEWDVFGGGGAHLEQGSVRLDNTLGQPVVGSYSDGDVALCVGFWCQSTVALRYRVNLPLLINQNP